MAAAFVAVAVVLAITLTGDDDQHAKISTEPAASTTGNATTGDTDIAGELAQIAGGSQTATEPPATEPQATAPRPAAPAAQAPPPVASPKPAKPAAKTLSCAPILGNGVPFPVRSSSSAAQPEPCQSARSVVLDALSSGSSQVGEWRCERRPSAAIEIQCTAGERMIVVETGK